MNTEVTILSSAFVNVTVDVVFYKHNKHGVLLIDPFPGCYMVPFLHWNIFDNVASMKSLQELGAFLKLDLFRELIKWNP